jgi:hypothetical protein
MDAMQTLEAIAEANRNMMETCNLKFRQHLIVGTKKWVFEKNITLPFLPFIGLTVYEPFGKDKEGKTTYMPWKIESYDRLDYYNDEDGYFLVSRTQSSHESESFLKRWASWGYNLVSQPVE